MELAVQKLLVAGLIGALSAQAAAAPPRTEWAWQCTFREKVKCEPRRGCTAVAPTVRAIVYPSRNLYIRCEGDDCDTYTAVYSGSGDTLTIELPGRGTFAKLTGDLAVTEVASLAHVILVSHGSCEEGPPPIITTER